MRSKPELTALMQLLKISIPNLSEITDFISHAIYTRPTRENLPCDSRYAMLFFEKGNEK